MRQLFNHWLVLCLLLGVAACGGTVPSAPGPVDGKSADPAAISKQQPNVPDKLPSIENQTAHGDELAMVRSPVTPPQPKPRTDPSLVIKPGDVSEVVAESVTEKLASEDRTTTLDVAEAAATEKPFRTEHG